MEKIIKIATVLLLIITAICSCKTQKSLEDYNHHAIERIANQDMSDSERVYLEKGRYELKEMRIISKKVRL